MSKRKYDWSDIDNPPLIEEHSIAKHEVLQSYLERYIRVMTVNPRRPLVKIHLIDGFAGGGLYRHETTKQLHPGSPLILLKTIERLEQEIQATRTNKFKIEAHYYFVEKEQKVFDFLTELLIKEGYKDKIGKEITLIKGTFVDVLRQLSSSMKTSSRKPRCVFLLDQYGYTDVPFNTLQFLFSTLPEAEVLLTFATDALINYMAETEEFKVALTKVGLADIVTEEIIRSFKETPTHELREARLAIEQLLATNILRQSGARFFTPFFITSRASSRSYWLVHLSSHVKARDEMNKVHWELTNYFHHYGDAGLNMLGFDPKKGRGEQFFLDYCFDDDAKKRTYDALQEDIPTIITAREIITFGFLLAETCNNTPANSEHYKKVLADLVAAKVIQITSADGKQRRRSASAIQEDDIITRARQYKLF